MNTNYNKLTVNVQDVWKGSILGSLAHAIMVAKYPFLSYEQSWDGANYNVQDGQGVRGTVSFIDNCCAAALRDDSQKKLFTGKEIDYLLMGVDKIIEGVFKEETLQYLLDEVNGEAVPTITAIFWGTDDLYTSLSIENMMRGGGNLLEKQFMKYQDAFPAWCEEYKMDDSQASLLEKLYSEKIKNPEKILIIEKNDVKIIEYFEEEGKEESIQSLKELNIFLP